MGSNEKPGTDRAQQLQDIIDELTSGAASANDPAPARPGGESLREAVHRRMREIQAASEADDTSTESAPGSDDQST
ncbi:hypothetical protein ACIRP3_43285 [Streptomyces sp. NPDC101209]|uniref:hypothetical protein n=1 Tax=Streptomyces sp. NPDC101209 TaxID=3366129 RepID=UPI00383047FC